MVFYYFHNFHQLFCHNVQRNCISRSCMCVFKLRFCFFLWVIFQMSAQTFCPSRSKVTLVAVVRFFSRVSFHMLPQNTVPSRGKVTLGAFVRFFSRVSFQVFFQIACRSRCIVAVFAFLGFFPGVSFQMCP